MATIGYGAMYPQSTAAHVVVVVESMVGMIALARQFEMQMKLLQTAESNEQRAAQLLSMNA